MKTIQPFIDLGFYTVPLIGQLKRLENGDKIIKVGEVLINDSVDLNALLNTYKPNDAVTIVFERQGVTKETLVTFQASNAYGLGLFETNNVELTTDIMANRKAWLQVN